jgi:adenylate cyclase
LRFNAFFGTRGKVAAGAGLGLLAWLVVLGFYGTQALEPFELKAYDRLCQTGLSAARAPSEIALVTVDQGSLDAARDAGVNWPWPRQMYAPIVQYAALAGAKAVAFDILYTEPSAYGVEDDSILAGALRENGHVQLALFLSQETRAARPWEDSVLRKGDLVLEDRTGSPVPDYPSVIPPIRVLAESAQGFGNVKISPDRDGIYRRAPLVFRHDGRWIPSLGLAVFRHVRQVEKAVLEAGALDLDSIGIPLDGDGNFLVTYYAGDEYPRFSAFNVIQSFVARQEGGTPLYPPEAFRDRILFIGFTAPGLYDLKSTPVSSIYPGMAIHATVVANLLQKDFRVRISRPVVMVFAAAVAALTGITVMLAAGYGQLLLTAVLYAGALLAFVALAFRQNIWVDAVMMLLSFGFAFAVTTAFSYATEGRQKRQIKQAFSHYMSDLLIQDLLKNPEKLRLGGERKVLTVFFSDLAGFTSLSEKLHPEEVVTLLNRYLTAMTDIILSSGGIIDKYEGDAIMAFWGAPLPQEDHAVRACHAAIDNQRRLVSLREEFAQAGLPPVRARIGINTGEMIIGNMGSSQRFDFTVIGDQVNLASRLEGAGKEYGAGIIISEETCRRAAEHIEVRELDLLQVKGRERPVRIFELLGRKGEVEEGLVEAMRVFSEGLDHYRNRRWTEAMVSFRRVLELRSGDGPSMTFSRRCEIYLKEPPPGDWDGVFRLTRK